MKSNVKPTQHDSTTIRMCTCVPMYTPAHYMKRVPINTDNLASSNTDSENTRFDTPSSEMNI